MDALSSRANSDFAPSFRRARPGNIGGCGGVRVPAESFVAGTGYGRSMPSPALTAWSTSSAAALSQLRAHRAVGGARALQLHYAYVLSRSRPATLGTAR